MISMSAPPIPLTLDTEYTWPRAGDLDLSTIPPPHQPRDLLGYLKDFETGWYSITNRQLGFGIGLTWDTEVFPYAWFWQELNASPGFPFYKCSYVIAIEPASSIPRPWLERGDGKDRLASDLAAGRIT